MELQKENGEERVIRYATLYGMIIVGLVLVNMLGSLLSKQITSIVYYLSTFLSCVFGIYLGYAGFKYCTTKVFKFAGILLLVAATIGTVGSLLMAMLKPGMIHR